MSWARTACGQRPACDLSTGVRTPDASTVAFQLSEPDPRFLEELSVLVPIPDGTPSGDVGTAPVPGTGPYDIESFVPGHLLILERNPLLRGLVRGGPTGRLPGRDRLPGGRKRGRGSRRVAAGQADLVQLVGDPDAARQLAAQHPAQVHTEAQQATVFVFLNTRTPPFDDVRVRRALNFALDRQRLADLFGAGLARPTCQIIPPTTAGYRAYCPYTVDPDAAGIVAWPGPAERPVAGRRLGNKGTGRHAVDCIGLPQRGRLCRRRSRPAGIPRPRSPRCRFRQLLRRSRPCPDGPGGNVRLVRH